MQEEILAFWFGDSPREERPEWFTKSAAFDALIRERFGAVLDAALDGAHAEWSGTARGSLARVVLLDQFTRNVYRGTPRAFAADALALETSSSAIAGGFDRTLLPYERWFLYMPFEHAEDREHQRRSVELFEALARDTGLTSPVEWARKHQVVIERFGRFPHRNEILGRPSTPDEEAFLRGPGSRF